MTKFEGDG